MHNKGVIIITEIELLEYQKIVKEIIDLEKRKERLADKEVDVVAGKVKASMSNYPYIETRVSVQMYDPVQIQQIDKSVKEYERKKSKLFEEQQRIELFISTINDSEVRQIFRYRFLDGMKQREIGKLMNLERSSVSKKISNYLKLSHNSQK